jgi:hypothetical protein
MRPVYRATSLAEPTSHPSDLKIDRYFGEAQVDGGPLILILNPCPSYVVKNVVKFVIPSTNDERIDDGTLTAAEFQKSIDDLVESLTLDFTSARWAIGDLARGVSLFNAGAV